MEKGMRDLDKIQEDEDYELHLGNKQVRFLTIGAVSTVFLVFVFGFLLGRHSHPGVPSIEIASKISSPLNGSVQKSGVATSEPVSEKIISEEPSKDVMDGAALEQDPAPVPVPETPELSAILAVKTLPRNDPLEDASGMDKPVEASEAPIPVTVPATKTVSSQYTVQVGAFEDLVGAERLSNRLKQKGYPSYVMVKAVPGKGVWHRVRVGLYSGRAEAEQAVKLLEEVEGLSTFITLYAKE
jgi:cell division septation protein DedD